MWRASPSMPLIKRLPLSYGEAVVPPRTLSSHLCRRSSNQPNPKPIKSMPRIRSRVGSGLVGGAAAGCCKSALSEVAALKSAGSSLSASAMVRSVALGGLAIAAMGAGAVAGGTARSWIEAKRSMTRPARPLAKGRIQLKDRCGRRSLLESRVKERAGWIGASVRSASVVARSSARVARSAGSCASLRSRSLRSAALSWLSR